MSWPKMAFPSKYFASYEKLPVSGKLLSFPLILFLSLWTTGTLGFIIFANYNLELVARKDTEDLALLLQQELQQKQKILHLITRWASKEKQVVDAVAEGDQALLLQTLSSTQTDLEIDFVRVLDSYGKSLVSLQRRSLEGVRVDDTPLKPNAQRQGSSTILRTDDAAPFTLVSLHPIQSSTQTIATLVLGIAIDDSLLKTLRGDSSIHLIAFEDDWVTASTLTLSQDHPWHFPQPNAAPTWIEIAGETYLIKTIQLSDNLNQTNLSIAVLKSIQDIERAEQKMFFVVGGFGLLGSILVIGMTYLGFRVTQSLSRRLQGLTEATQQLAEGNLSIRLPIENDDEIGTLAQSFNTMAEQLTARDQKLAQQVKRLKNILKELHQTQSQMVQSEKMSALGQMVAGIAHEINNPLNFIYGNLEPLQEYFQDLLTLLKVYQTQYPQPKDQILAIEKKVDLDFILEDSAHLLESMTIGTERVQEIVLSLRNYSRLDEATIKAVDIHEGIESTLLILNHRIKDGVEIIKNYGSLPKVRCSPAQINQVLTNLMVNAIDAMFEADCDPKQLTITTCEISSEQVVQISIRDNGIGIPAENKNKIFDPFFTTKGIGQGTGLGLGICFKIIQRHQGTIEVNSDVGKGTEFVITLPQEAPFIGSDNELM